MDTVAVVGRDLEARPFAAADYMEPGERSIAPLS
jgi:hypothetical protein